MKVRKKRRPAGLLKIKEGFSYYQKSSDYTVLLEEISQTVFLTFPILLIHQNFCQGGVIKLTVKSITVGNTTRPKMMMVVFAHSVKVMELVQKEVIRKFSRGISTQRISIFRVGRKNVIKEDTTHRCLIEKVAAHVSLLLLLKCLCF